jgi:phycoerythrin-associated linker protein
MARFCFDQALLNSKFLNSKRSPGDRQGFFLVTVWQKYSLNLSELSHFLIAAPNSGRISLKKIAKSLITIHLRHNQTGVYSRRLFHMVSTISRTIVNPGSKLGMGGFEDMNPVQNWLQASAADRDTVIRAIYRQVLGNAHVMDSERLTVAESQFKRGDLSVREFVRQLAKSALYRSRFVDNCYRYRTIELNYKHLLGRAPQDFDEMRSHSDILDQHGFEADIDSYIDSDEYQDAFGENTVPYYRGLQSQTGQSMLGFTNTVRLVRSASSSDKNIATGNRAQLTNAIIRQASPATSRSTDANDILASIFNNTVPTSVPTPVVAAAPLPTFTATSAEITRLQKELADLQSAARLGAAYLKNDWVPPAGATVPQQVEALQQQIAIARSYATIGEARMNKWRQRSY